MENIVDKYLELVKKSEKYFLNQDDINSSNYNKITKSIWKLQDKILEEDNYREIYTTILDKIGEQKYWQMNYDIAGSLYNKDKIMALNIYKKFKWCPIADSRIDFIEKELEKKWKH